MSPDLKQFELDRITNMLKSFSWEVVTSRFEGDKILVQYQKDLKGSTADAKKFELDRIVNMLGSFGWVTMGNQNFPDKVVVNFEKVIKTG